MSKINQEMKQMKTFSDQLQGSLKKCFEKLEHHKVETQTNFHNTKEDYKERFTGFEELF